MRYPTISVIMATLNSGQILDRCLKTVRAQDYPQAKIEIIVADGGSTDNTPKTIKKYGGRVIRENTRSPEAAKAVALRQAGNELVLEIDDDTVLPDPRWLGRMVACLLREPQAVGCYTWRYTYQRDGRLLNRYFSLFGVNDPVPYFLKKADRQSYLADRWQLAGKARDKGNYFLVTFNSRNLPTVGANGFLIRRALLLKAQVDEKHFFHIDVNQDLVNLGYNQYVVVKNDVVHASGENFWRFFARRKRYMEELYLRDTSNRRYFLYHKERDRGQIGLFSFYALTLIGPTLEAVRGYRRIADPAWFLHPVVCFLIFWIYFLEVINWQSWHYLGLIKRRFNRKPEEATTQPRPGKESYNPDT